ncbi:Nuclear control of ATPase protein 2 [Rhodotorula mucilaginosa]|uniref:Nuclear control of ATPase protein 2 n=1 Tax=Rhodotorula mucilaginosa TaxID=5537 RepID=A0A9P6W182_RHOMI|nr:Nuclear control of ATPase protein 2 [Rhodotorula mucilaginosa]
MSTYASDLTASLSTALVQLAPTLVPSSPLAPPPQATPPAAGLTPPGQLGATQSDSDTLNEARQDRETQLLRVLAQLQPPHASSSSSSSSAPSQVGASSSSSAALNGNQSHRLHSPQELANIAQSLFFPSDEDPTTTTTSTRSEDPQLATVEYVVLAQLAIAAYGTVLRTLMHEAHRLESSDQYWSAVESQPLETALYLVQSTPERALSLGRVSLARFKQLALSAQSKGGSRPAILSRETWRRAVPPSLFLTAVFPHLSTSAGLPSLASIYNDGGGEQPGEAANSVRPTSATSATSAAAAAVAPANLARLGRQTARSLLFLTLSPLSLTRAEIAHKRRSLRQQRDRLATMIGELTLAANAGGAVEEDTSVEEDDDDDDDERVTKADLRRRPGLAQLFGLAAQQEDREGTATLSLEDVKQATFQTLNHLEIVLAPTSPGAGSRATESVSAPQTPTQIARHLANLLTGTLTAHQASFRSSAHALAPPSALARAWPYLLSVPLVGGIVARTVYNHRASLRLWVQETVSTVRGFLIDWVVEPVRQILETLRGGEEGGIALMGRESLQSDLASLERMVVDFARDEYKLGPEQLQVLAQQVRAGDLTPVLRVWEEDIKSPIKSAVRGSLVRTLLIQVQKVKVDVALAMDGIEKMLKSQQLTFGFVGVAPSMLILALVGRDLDLLLTPTRARAGPSSPSPRSKRPGPASSPNNDNGSKDDSAAAALTQGHLLLSLSSLRSFAHSSHFPSRDTQLRSAFLDDVRAVEDGATQAATEERRALVRRLERWSDALGWDEGVRS